MTLGVLSRLWKSSLTLALGIGLAFGSPSSLLSYRHTLDDAAVLLKSGRRLSVESTR